MRSNRNHLIARSVVLLICVAALTRIPLVRAAAEPGQKVFASPNDAAAAAVAALTNDDRTELLAIFGEQSKGLAISGDPVADANASKTFLHAWLFSAENGYIYRTEDQMIWLDETTTHFREVVD